MKKQLLNELKRQRSSVIQLRLVSVVFIASVLFGLTTCTPKAGKDNTVSVYQNYDNYPPELTSYIKEQCRLHNSAHRKSETYVEIDQLAYYDNIQLLKKRFLKDSCLLLAVVKTDAYGCGIEYLAKVAEFAGADYIGITENSEILKLRSVNIKLPVLRLRLAGIDELKAVHTNPKSYGEIEELVGNLSMARFISKLAVEQNKIIKIHISLNTGGMSREGFEMHVPSTKDSIGELLKLKNIYVRGIMTHFANADTDSIENLKKLVTEFRNDAESIISMGQLNRQDVLLHAAASSLTIRVPESHLDMVRPGTITYGAHPTKEAMEAQKDFKPVMSFYSSIGQIMFYPAGNKVGYGSTYQLEKDSYLANLPFGWSNGLPRTSKYALINGQRINIVGRISMNATMIDYSGQCVQRFRSILYNPKRD
jgi:alanine racemase